MLNKTLNRRTAIKVGGVAIGLTTAFAGMSAPLSAANDEIRLAQEVLTLGIERRVCHSNLNLKAKAMRKAGTPGRGLDPLRDELGAIDEKLLPRVDALLTSNPATPQLAALKRSALNAVDDQAWTWKPSSAFNLA